MAKLKCDLRWEDLDYVNQHLLNYTSTYFRVSQNDPFFALGPMKVEILHLDPMIEMYYDVVSQGESR